MKWDTECQFVSCSTILCHPHHNMGVTFGTGGQNAMKKTAKFYPEIFECKVFMQSNNYNNRLIFQRDMFGVTIVFFPFIANW